MCYVARGTKSRPTWNGDQHFCLWMWPRIAPVESSMAPHRLISMRFLAEVGL